MQKYTIKSMLEQPFPEINLYSRLEIYEFIYLFEE
jgi:hypothetical protein